MRPLTERKRRYRIEYQCPHTNVDQTVTVEFVTNNPYSGKEQARRFADRISGLNPFTLEEIDHDGHRNCGQEP